jgi:hypothetical protein
VTLFDHLDYLYTPSRDVAADARYFTEILGGRLVFAIEAMGTGWRWSSSLPPDHACS